MAFRLILIIMLSFIIWLEREIKHQPAWLRTHILIWLGSTLIMIISIMMPELYNSPVSDPARIAAQVVTGIWFLGAWVIMRMWFSTKGLTTAANIWVTSAIWLAVWAWLYIISILATLFILFNLTVITSIKNKYIKQSRYCNIKVDIKKNKLSLNKLVNTIELLPIKIISKDIKESENKITISLVSDLSSEINTYEIHERLRSNIKIEQLTISENIK